VINKKSPKEINFRTSTDHNSPAKQSSNQGSNQSIQSKLITIPFHSSHSYVFSWFQLGLDNNEPEDVDEDLEAEGDPDADERGAQRTEDDGESDTEL